MRVHTRSFLLACLTAAAASQAVAGVVEVSFVDAARFSDTGSTPWERQANLNTLTSHLQVLAKRHLSADQVLKIEVLNVDLAGEPQPLPRAGRDLRIVRGKTDWPRIQLRYSLEAAGKPLLNGEEAVTDMDYSHGLLSARYAEPLRHEKRMLEHWFKTRLIERRAD
jgi:hypothetical protein